jgi:hypothetical protein
MNSPEVKPTIGDMLRHAAASLERDANKDVPVIAAAVVILRADGQWSAMSSPGLSAFIGSSLLDHAKIDLILGGQRWTEFQPQPIPAANEKN